MKQAHPEHQRDPVCATPLTSLQELQRKRQQLQQEAQSISAELDELIADMSKEWQFGEDSAGDVKQCGEMQ